MFTRNPTLDEIATAAVALIKPHIGSRYLSLVFEGPTAAIAWNATHVNLILPGWDYGQRVPRGLADAWVGYYIHEMGHVLHSDMTAWKQAIAEGLQGLVNGLEDARMERKVMRTNRFPNAKACLETVLATVLEDAKSDAAFDPADPRQLGFVLAVAGRARLSGMATDTAREWLDALPGNVRPDVDAALADLDRATSTQEVLEIARRLARNPTVQQQVQQGQGQQGQGQQGQGQQGQAGGAGAGIRDPNAKAARAPKGFKPKRNNDSGTARGRAASYNGEVNTETFVHRSSNTAPLSDALTQTGRLRQAITNALRAPETVDHEHRQVRGKLTARSYAGIATGDPAIWTRRTTRPGTDCAVALVLDGSGSMGGVPHIAQSRLAYALATAAESAGAQVAIAAFEDGAHTTNGALTFRGVKLMVIKGFRERLRAAAPALAGYGPNSGTPLPGAFLHAATWLVKSTPHASRRIVLMLTDGDPSQPDSRATVNAAIDLIGVRLAGQVEIACLGIGADVSYMRCPTAVCNDLQSLAVDGLDLLVKTLKARGEAIARAAA